MGKIKSVLAWVAVIIIATLVCLGLFIGRIGEAINQASRKSKEQKQRKWRGTA
jgi:prolipoprotein diacylglyceryltransferase